MLKTTVKITASSVEDSINSATISAGTVSTIQEDTDSISTAECEQRKLSVSELAGERLYFQALERSKRMAIIAGNPADSIKIRHGSASTVSTIKKTVDTFIQSRVSDNVRECAENVRIVHKNGLNAIRLVQSTPVATRWNKIQMRDIKVNEDPYNNRGRGILSISEIAGCRLYLKAMERNKQLEFLSRNIDRNSTSSMIQMKDIKINVDPDNITRKGKKSTAEIAGCRLYLKAMERNKRLALLSNVSRSSSSCHIRNDREPTGLKRCDLRSADICQRLYVLSKPMQEDGRARRKDITEACKKSNEVWIHPAGNISIADSTRLYHIGMRQLVALEKRRIEASELNYYKSYLFTTLQELR